MDDWSHLYKGIQKFYLVQIQCVDERMELLQCPEGEGAILAQACTSTAIIVWTPAS